MILIGDSLDKLKELEDNLVDSVVTDPPYGLSFMGNKWDYDVPSTELWAECLRVLKPGGHLVSFSSARTYHRMTVNVEDAGFEIRDQLMWVYGQGFPKNYNVGKKVADYEGWGTALKPAHEPIVLARKPLSEKNLADNVRYWGTGAINIDASRVSSSQDSELVGRHPANLIHDGSQQVLDLFPDSAGSGGSVPQTKVTGFGDKIGTGKADYLGGPRTKVDCGTGSAARFFYCAKPNKTERNAGCDGLPEKQKVFNGQSSASSADMKDVEKRFTTLPAANNHPTVKPIALMEYLVKLVTPAGGLVIDPFVGSGSTGCAAIPLGYEFIGIDLDADYVRIAEARIAHSMKTGNRS